jgi:hypothetical protein
MWMLWRTALYVWIIFHGIICSCKYKSVGTAHVEIGLQPGLFLMRPCYWRTADLFSRLEVEMAKIRVYLAQILIR